MSGPEVLELRAGPLRLALRPDLGAAIAGLWRDGVPVLHSVEPGELSGPRRSGGFVLAPYSNRIGEGVFTWQGETHRLAVHEAGRPHALHGVAWARPWRVVGHDQASAELRLDHAPDEDWPFAFSLRQRLTLQPGLLRLDLLLVNTDARAWPAGLGWHPYFPKRPGSHLRLGVTGRWERDDAWMLPTARTPVAGIDAPVAELALDHGFDGFDGRARIDDEVHRLVLSSRAEHLVVFTPAAYPFFAVEPVSHRVNAVQADDPLAAGLRVLAPGRTLDFSALLQIEPAPGAAG